jgi:transcription initiation factor TFIIIB Brf1 subunit/transcription initiation factor TFIIB
VKLAAIKSEIKRIKECAGLPQHVAEEAEELAKRYLGALKGFPAGGRGCGCVVGGRQGGRRA